MNSKPNILFIMADQYRFDFMGCAGASFVKTPNIDRLAQRGMRFTQCTTNSPVCAPARIALATGLQPTRIGTLSNDSFLPLSAVTYYQRLRNDGYRVGCVGKLDLAKPDGYNGRYGDRPCAYSWGFTHPEECEGKEHAGQSSTPIGPYTHYLAERNLLQAFHEDYKKRRTEKNLSRDSILPTDAFEDSYIGRRAAKWISEIPDDFPWHYFVSFVGPHNPYDPPTEYAERYRKAAMPDPIQGSLENKPHRVKKKSKSLDSETVTMMRRQYCASIELIDDQIGSIIQALEKRRMLENTFIIFSSDHGEMLGDHGLWTKHMAYEASLRVPLIVAGPGIQAGSKSDALIELIDLNATFCELAGVRPQENIDARSFRSVLFDPKLQHRENAVSAEEGFCCIRTDRYKLISTDNDLPELYDLQKDPNELNNIAESENELFKSLFKQMKRRFREGKWHH